MKDRLRHIILLLLFCMASLQAMAQEKFSRGLEQISFIPRGQWITGVNVSYSQSSFDNYQFLIIENLGGDTYNFKVSPMLMYCFHDNLAAGGRFAYSRSRTRLDNARVVIDSETDYEPGQLYSISQNYYGTAAFRNYISLGQSMRFGFFNEVQLQLGGGQSKIVNGEDEDLTGTYSRNFSLDVGLTPGFIMFLNNYSAIEVSIGVLGFSYHKTHSITDQIYIADYNTKSANFKINLFSISFGVAFYL
ncbi:MAG: hypothetical protein NC039_06575 [Muribaculaceae bacterium]|nr:hypothetical protein [Muribaculaceae bacterium]